MVDQRKLIGCAAAVVGVPALFYADWKLVSVATILILLFGLSCLVGFLTERAGLILSSFLVISVVISQWWLGEYTGPGVDVHLGLGVLSLLAGLAAVAGALTGGFVRRIVDRRGHQFET